jgi:anti-anti-sigma regulatory factor
VLFIFTSKKKRILRIKMKGSLSDYLGRDIDLFNMSKNYKGVVIDLSGVSHIDSTGLVDLLNWSIEANNKNLPVFFKGISIKDLNRLKTLGLSEIVSGNINPTDVA